MVLYISNGKQCEVLEMDLFDLENPYITSIITLIVRLYKLILAYVLSLV